MIDYFKRLVDRVFSGRYIHAEVNIVQLVMYRFAYPFAVQLNRLGLSANLITTFSLVFSLLAFAALAFHDGWVWFTIFWGISVLLDFCDGTVARMSDSVSKSAFRYDHMSDLFKIFLLFMGAGLRYGSGWVWIVALLVLFLFMYFMILNHDIVHIRKLLLLKVPVNNNSESQTATVSKSEPVEPGMRIRERYRIVAWLVKFDSLYKLWRLLWPPLTTINGHTLLLFFLLPYGPEVAMLSLGYLGLIALVGIKGRITELLVIPKP